MHTFSYYVPVTKVEALIKVRALSVRLSVRLLVLHVTCSKTLRFRAMVNIKHSQGTPCWKINPPVRLTVCHFRLEGLRRHISRES